MQPVSAVRRLLGRVPGILTPAKAVGVHGRVDLASADLVEGWIVADNEPTKRRRVKILLNGKEVGEIVAGDFRKDLKAAGIGVGDGCYALSHRLPALDPGEHVVQVVDCETSYELEGSPRSIWAPVPPSASRLPPVDAKPVDPGIAEVGPDERPANMSGLHGKETAMALRVCIVSCDILGPIRNGGVGTACAALAQELALAGHSVTLLYTLQFYENGDEEVWRAFYRQFGIDFRSLPASSTPSPVPTPTIYEWDAVENSYRVYEYLKTRAFDIIHFPVHAGLGYFTALARRQGIAFETTRIWVTCHAPTLWSRRGNLASCDDIAFHVRDRLERGLVENCDRVLSPSQYMLDWLGERGWSLPGQPLVAPNLLPRSDTAAVAAESEPLPATWRGIPKELVFFGRAETRKGLQIFCDAIERLVGRLPNTLEITFLGKPSPQLGEEWLGARVKHWPFGWKIIDDYNSFQATQYLRGTGRLAVMPSVVENSPHTVLECLYLGIPFLATDVGGVAELIMDEDRPKVLCQPNPIALADAIRRVFEVGTASARPANSPASAEQVHRDLHCEIDDAPAAISREGSKAPPKAMPLVSVCILHLNRGPELTKAVESVFAQTYKNLEVIVVDNGSQCRTAIEHLDRLEARYEPDRLSIIRLPENVYEPKGRNAAAAVARGDFVLFMDDDNRAKPHEVEYFVNAAQRTGADIYTCFADRFETEDVPERDAAASGRLVVIGDAGPVGMIFNAYGDLNFFVRRDRFTEVGGFIEDLCFNHAEDWRFLARAYSSGLRISVVPEALYWYKSQGTTGGASSRKRDIPGALYRAAEGARAQPLSDDAFLLLAQGLFWRAADAQRELEWLREQLGERAEELTSLRSALAQQRRMNEHAHEALEVLHEGFRQVVEACEGDPRVDALWEAAQHRYLPYMNDPTGSKVSCEGRPVRTTSVMKNIRKRLWNGLSFAKPRH